MNSQNGSPRRGWYHGHSSRRRFLAGAAALSAGAVVGARLPLGARAGAAEAGTAMHGTELRGMYLTSKSRLAEGRFGTMFKSLPAYSPPDDLLDDLAATMVEPDTSDDFLATSSRLFAGFTFIGQFLDHDITLDTTPLDLQASDPDATVNFRTPRYDLDSVYGRGPAQDPQLYEPDGVKLLLRPNVNGVLDVPRDEVTGKAMIGDPRNDENLIVLQFHKAMIQFHNK